MADAEVVSGDHRQSLRRLRRSVGSRTPGVRPLFGDVGALPFGTPGRYGRAVALDNESGRAHERMMLGETRPGLARLERVATRLPAGAAREGTRRRMRSGLLRLIRGRDREPIYQSILVLDDRATEGQSC